MISNPRGATNGVSGDPLLARRYRGPVPNDVAALHPANGLPDGQTYHAAGPTEGGYLIAAVWDSKESADCFTNDTLLASLPVEGGFEGAPEERVAEVSNLAGSLR